MSCGARSTTSCQSGTFVSRTRIGFASTRARNSSPSASAWPSRYSRQRGEVRGPALGVAHRVEVQRDPGEPEVAVEAVEQRDDLDVERRVVDAEHLGAELPVLAVPALLRRARSGSSARRTRPSRAGSGRCCTYARTTDAVPSGRSARVRPPLSSNSYISLLTTSVCSPTRRNTSTCSKTGLTIRP